MKQRFGVVKELCTEVLAKVAQHSIDKGSKLGRVAISEEQVGLLAEKHVDAIYHTAYTTPLALHRANEIVREVSARWNMRSTYLKVAAALDKLG